MIGHIICIGQLTWHERVHSGEKPYNFATSCHMWVLECKIRDIHTSLLTCLSLLFMLYWAISLMQVEREDGKPEIYKCAIRCSPLYIISYPLVGWIAHRAKVWTCGTPMTSLKVVALDIFSIKRKNIFYSSNIFLISYGNSPVVINIIVKDRTLSVSQTPV